MTFKKRFLSVFTAVALVISVMSSTFAADKPYVLGFGDSGVGGLIFAIDAYKELLPFLIQVQSKYEVSFKFHHIGDTKNAPYGSRPPQEIRALTKDFMDYLGKDADIAVVACNTASTVYDKDMTDHLSATIPNTRTMAIIEKSADTLYKKGKVVTKDGKKTLYLGVLATPATIKSGQYQRELERIHAERLGKEGVQLVILTYAPQTWVYNIEHGVDTKITKADVEKDMTAYLANPQTKDMTAVGLFCTHYPFFKKDLATIFSKAGHKNVAFIAQGALFSGKIRKEIEEDIAAGKLQKRAKPLAVKAVAKPDIISDITGENINEVKDVVKTIAPELLTKIDFNYNVKLK